MLFPLSVHLAYSYLQNILHGEDKDHLPTKEGEKEGGRKREGRAEEGGEGGRDGEGEREDISHYREGVST